MLDLSRVLAGPLATSVLGDLGADVLKVERHPTGDDTRGWGPPFHGDDAAYFLAANRNRRCVALDLSTSAGAAVVRRLARSADVVVENFLPRHLRSLGLDAVRDATPDAVWVSVRGAGTDGPEGERPGYDVMAQARGGLMGVTGHPETGPVKVGVAISDVVSGLFAAVAALAGVIGRRAGSDASEPAAPRIEVPLLECTVSALVNQATNHLVGGADPAPMGNDHPNLAPYGPVQCADRPLVVGAGNDRQFRLLCTALDHPTLADDPRFATNALRIEHREELAKELSELFRVRTADAWAERLTANGVPCAPVNSVAEALADPAVTATDLIQTVDHPAGELRLLASPLRVDGRRPPVHRAPPLRGEHTREVLHALGLSAAQVDALASAGVCGGPATP